MKDSSITIISGAVIVLCCILCKNTIDIFNITGIVICGTGILIAIFSEE